MPYLMGIAVLFENMCCFGLKYIKNISMERLFTNQETLRYLAENRFLNVSAVLLFPPNSINYSETVTFLFVLNKNKRC